MGTLIVLALIALVFAGIALVARAAVRAADRNIRGAREPYRPPGKALGLQPPPVRVPPRMRELFAEQVHAAVAVEPPPLPPPLPKRPVSQPIQTAPEHPPTFTSTTIVPGTTIDRYVIEKPIGSGGMAHVFLVRHTFLGTRHALKVLAADAAQSANIRERFLAEGQIQARLRHPNIVPVTDIVAVPGVVGLVMDYVDGETLDDVIGRMPGPPRVSLVQEIFRPVLAGVGFAHAQGIVHRDLKPSNVLIARAPDGTLDVRIVDFGIAKITGVASEGRKATRTGAMMGTPQYMSPEQIQGAKLATARSDVFSLGATLYELATGKVAFDGDSDFDIQLRITQGRFPKPGEAYAGIDPGLAAVIEKALAIDPQKRFASCEEMSRALG